MHVNFFALQKYWQMLSANPIDDTSGNRMSDQVFSLLSSSEGNFKIGCFLEGLGTKNDFGALQDCFSQINEFSPSQYYQIFKTTNKQATVSTVLSLLKLSCHDPDMMHRYRNLLIQELNDDVMFLLFISRPDLLLIFR